VSIRVRDALFWCFTFLPASALSFALALPGAHGKNLDGRYDNAPKRSGTKASITPRANGAATRVTATPTSETTLLEKTAALSSITRASAMSSLTSWF
jgi:hypothetical protein